MTSAPENEGIDENKPLCFNGVNATTGSYLFESMSMAQLADVALGNPRKRDLSEDEQAHLAELENRRNSRGKSHFGVKESVDPTKLEQAGWGVIFPSVKAGSPEEREQAAIYEALSPLLALRKSQATRLKENRYQEYRGDKAYRPSESKDKYISRLGGSPGPVDPDRVPYFLLIVGSPDVIPYRVQYEIDVSYAVGRICFDSIEEYANYARSVVAAETGGLTVSREIAFVGVANPDDDATQGSRRSLVGPLADKAERWIEVPDWKVTRYFDGDASKAKVAQLFGGPQTPALLFSGSHGVGFEKGHRLQLRHQGALLLQDWPGPNFHGPIKEDLYLSGDDLRSDAGLLGMIAFNFACYGAGTPKFDDFSKRDFTSRTAIADKAFVSGLHRKMLGHPKGGALATIGHVERAWDTSFLWGTGKKGASEAQLAVFESTLLALMKGKPVGVAVEYLNERYSEMGAMLAAQLEVQEYPEDRVSVFELANMWTSTNDARGYAVVGDPAVRLPLGTVGGAERSRESINVSLVPPSVPPDVPQGPAAPNTVPSDKRQATNSFSFFRDDKESEKEPVAPAESKPGMLESFASKVVGTLSQVVEDVMTLEVRTYVSSNTSAAADADRTTLSQQGDLRAFTRIMIDGDIDAIVPERDGVVDTALWNLHIELVKQAQANRTELMKMLLSSLTGILKV